MMKLIAYQRTGENEEACYTLSNSLNGNTVTSEVSIKKIESVEYTEVNFKIDPVRLKQNDTEAALDQMADWLIRCGQSLKERGKSENNFAINYKNK